MKANNFFDLGKGRLLVGLLVGYFDGKRYIAEIVNEDPLMLKVEESGKLANLELKDFAILERESHSIQGDIDAQNSLLDSHNRSNYGPLISGLYRLGSFNGRLEEIRSLGKPISV